MTTEVWAFLLWCALVVGVLIGIITEQDLDKGPDDEDR